MHTQTKIPKVAMYNVEAVLIILLTRQALTSTYYIAVTS